MCTKSREGRAASRKPSAKSSPARLSAHQLSQGDVVLARVFNAPRALVFKAWTDPKLTAQWWGPRGFTNPVCEMDVRRGGAILIHMRGPDGIVYPMSGVYQEVVEPECCAGQSGRAALRDTEHHHIRQERSGTKLTVEALVVKTTAAAAPHLAGAVVGWSQSLERLEAFLSKTSG